MKRIILCADDYGQDPAISAGILTLIKRNRISATTCLVNTPHWENLAKPLIPCQREVEIGLHFNLTEGHALSKEYIEYYGINFFSLPSLIKRAFLRQLNSSVIAFEFEAQIKQFVSELGFWPHFIDGHHHVHQLPAIREALIQVYLKTLGPHHPYIRLVNEKIYWFDSIHKNLKKLMIHATGAGALKRLLEQHNMPHNHSFAGIYSFGKAKNYGHVFRGFLKGVKDGAMIMCHPGFLSPSPMGAARHHEYLYLASDEFLTDCDVYDIKLSHFNSV